MSYTARGLLADLLSRPDGWREDGRKMADTSPQGRLAVAKALRELAAFGYYLVERVRHADGTFSSQVHVFDVPGGAGAVAPGAVDPGPGRPAADGADAHPVNTPEKEPTLPRQRVGRRAARDAALHAGAGGRESSSALTAEPPDAGTGEAAALLHRVTAPEPRLRLGAVEAAALAPLVTPWLDRGYGPRELAHALLDGLPGRIHSASALLRDRLTRKLPPAAEPPAPPRAPRPHECTECGRPTAHEGMCGLCENLNAPLPAAPSEHATAATRGRALVRAFLESSALDCDIPLPGGA
ncbi:hypothetical protein [Streptomyces sp. NRRL F-5126]|uniref:hypothetical protein n=1 Tax=Streptomyces sp. NRRL F-5126 TaxID=1463857 RepID=UPI0004C6C1CE|nr:hypothetical protein [Streptomyces sp. NRRL F-5126]